MLVTLNGKALFDIGTFPQKSIQHASTKHPNAKDLHTLIITNHSDRRAADDLHDYSRKRTRRFAPIPGLVWHGVTHRHPHQIEKAVEIDWRNRLE